VRQALRNAIRLVLQRVVEVYLSSGSRVEFSPDGINRILVFAYHGLGNFIMYTPALRLLRARYPNAQIDLQVGNNTGCEEVLEGTRLFQNVCNLPYRAGVLAWIRRAIELRRLRYDLTISEFHSHSWPLLILIAASRAPFRLGHVTSPGWGPSFSRYSFAFNIPVQMREDEHEIERYLDLVAAVGVPKTDHTRAQTVVHLSESDHEFAMRFLHETGEAGSKRVIGFQPGTSAMMRWKQWPVERYRELIETVVTERSDARVVLFGSAPEASMIEEMARGLGPRVTSAAGKTSVKQAAALIQACDLLVCNDSGLMHTAVAVGTPVIAIYGPTDIRRTAPLGEMHTTIRHDLPCSPCFKMEGDQQVQACPHHDCLMTISPDEVFQVVTTRVRPGAQATAERGSD
jgi:lipopolysaccharide heptosyltransferase II